MRRLAQNSDGYLLLEVIVALAVLGLILASIFQMTYQSGRSILNHEIQARSLLTAHSLSAWWLRLPDTDRRALLNMPFQPVSQACGLRDPSEFVWKIQRKSGNGATYLLLTVRHASGRDVTVAVPEVSDL